MTLFTQGHEFPELQNGYDLGFKGIFAIFPRSFLLPDSFMAILVARLDPWVFEATALRHEARL